MGIYLGIDLGTTGLKALLLRENGMICGSGYAEYPISIPEAGFAEQNPLDWWHALKSALAHALNTSGINADEIVGIGLSGQMHSTVILGQNNELLYPSIIWCDQRAIPQVQQIHELIGTDQLGKWTQNPVAAGFQSTSIMWLRDNKPDIFAKIGHILLPKDYIRFLLTGEFGTEPTDACSTLLFDCAKRTWSSELLETLQLDSALFPKVAVSPTQVQGKLCSLAAAELGLSEKTIVVYGGGDQPMQAIGNGILRPGDASITLGTGGQIFAPIAWPQYDPQLRLHMFCHAPEDTWYTMGAILNCCLAQNWFFEKVLETHNFAAEHQSATKVAPGCNGMFFLPYLTGERTPHMDAEAKGIFIGMNLAHDRSAMVRAVIEGICYALKDAMGCVRELKPDINRLILSGGGARSMLWRQIIADMMNQPIYTTNMTEEAGTGAAMCAMVGAGAYASLQDACNAIVRYEPGCVLPNMENAAFYEEHFPIYQSIYQANRSLFTKCV